MDRSRGRYETALEAYDAAREVLEQLDAERPDVRRWMAEVDLAWATVARQLRVQAEQSLARVTSAAHALDTLAIANQGLLRRATFAHMERAQQAA
ncbi:MAG: hypothetical protein MK101_06690 [Phycisphaerales bacterium]|nr:hypothetical protein [Phycisphaerales bacterium]